MNQNSFFPAPWLFELLVPFLVFLITLLAGYIARKIVLNRLLCWARNTKTRLDDIIIESIKGPVIIWFLMLGIYFGLEVSHLPLNYVRAIDKLLLILGIFSITLVLANISSRMIRTYSSRFDSALPVTSLTQNVSRIVIFCVGLLVILNSLGISITPILATLGVGGLAVALALQDTLANLFAGFHIAMAREIKIGDYIKLDSGEEGYVTDIHWRTTRIKMLPNNVVLVPNDKLTKMIVTNYYLPDKEILVAVDLNVHSKSDLEKVEGITIDVAREVMKNVPGGVSGFEPFVRYAGYGDSGVSLKVIMRAKEFADQHLVKHEFIKRLHKRYSQEGIVIPYPVRAINYEQEK